LSFGPAGVLECVRVAPLPGCHRSWSCSSGGLLVAAGGVDTRVHLFTVTGASGSGASDVALRPVRTLAGHMDWVRSLDISWAGMDA
jgi:hypothetical protein